MQWERRTTKSKMEESEAWREQTTPAMEEREEEERSRLRSDEKSPLVDWKSQKDQVTRPGRTKWALLKETR